MKNRVSCSLCGRGKSSLPWQSLSHKPIKFWIHGLIPHPKGYTSGEDCLRDQILITYPWGSLKVHPTPPSSLYTANPTFPSTISFSSVLFIFFLPLFLRPFPPSDILHDLPIHHMYCLVAVLPWLDHKLPKKDLYLLCLLIPVRCQ